MHVGASSDVDRKKRGRRKSSAGTAELDTGDLFCDKHRSVLGACAGTLLKIVLERVYRKMGQNQRNSQDNAVGLYYTIPMVRRLVLGWAVSPSRRTMLTIRERNGMSWS